MCSWFLIDTLCFVLSDKPRVECDPAGASLGEKVVLTCRGHMNPRLDLASVTWKRKPDTFTLTQSEPQLGRHLFAVEVSGLI